MQNKKRANANTGPQQLVVSTDQDPKSTCDQLVDYYIQPKPIFLSKSKSLFVPTACNVNIYSNSGGELLNVLRKHEYRIVGIHKDPISPDEIITCDEKANIYYWNSSPPKHLQLSFPKVSNPTVTYFSFGKDSYLVGFLQNGKTILFEYQKSSNSKPRFVVYDVLLGPNTISTSNDGMYLVAAKQNNLYVTEFPYNMNPSKTRCHRTQRTLTCALCHPEQDLIAVGDNIGSVMLWYNTMEMYPVKVDLHWHTLPIADISFSALGNVLYSGSGECVIVKWNLAKDCSRSFLPRLGMPIRYIVEDEINSFVAAVHIDNAISLINAREMKLEGLVQTLTTHVPTIDCEVPLPVGLLVNPKTHEVIKNGRTGHLQFFNPHAVKMLFNLDVTLCNFVNEERNQKLPNADVIRAALSDDGSWLVTNEVCGLTSNMMESILKFWYFSPENQRWELNTSIQQPHNDKISCISLRPNPTLSEDLLCCTCSEDGTFKIWKSIQYEDLHGKLKTHWNNREQRDFRDLPATTCTFSPDSSLLAVAFGSVVTMWTPDDCSYLGSLSQPFLTEKIIDITFNYGDREGTLFITRSENWLCTWDIMSCSLLWRVSLASSCLAVDHASGAIAVFSKNKEVSIYNPHQSKPLTELSNIGTYQVIAAAFVSNKNQENQKEMAPWLSNSDLFYFDEKQSFFKMDSNNFTNDNLKSISGAPLNAALKDETQIERKMFSSLVGASRNITHLNQQELAQQPITSVPSSKTLMEQLLQLTISNIKFSSLTGCLDSFLPNISSEDGNLIKENLIEYKIEEETPKTAPKMTLKVEEDLNSFELIKKINFQEIVASINS